MVIFLIFTHHLLLTWLLFILRRKPHRWSSKWKIFLCLFACMWVGWWQMATAKAQRSALLLAKIHHLVDALFMDPGIMCANTVRCYAWWVNSWFSNCEENLEILAECCICVLYLKWLKKNNSRMKILNTKMLREHNVQSLAVLHDVNAAIASRVFFLERNNNFSTNWIFFFHWFNRK